MSERTEPQPTHGTREGVTEVFCAVHGWVGNLDWLRFRHDQHGDRPESAVEQAARESYFGTEPQPTSEPLDVERLARALHSAQPHWQGSKTSFEDHRSGHVQDAEAIAAEYARLSEPKS